MGRIGLIEGIYPLRTPEETIAFGKKLGQELASNTVLALTGDLGAGKTTFVKGLALGLGIEESIQSPTFVLMNQYSGLVHFDLYRLKNSEDFLNLGFDEYFESNQILAIEWPERIEAILPKRTFRIHFSYVGKTREAKI